MGIAASGVGAVYVAGETISLIFPTTPNSYQPSSKKTSSTVPGEGSVFVSKIDLTSPTACNIVLSSNSASIPRHGGSGSFTFTVPDGCPWEVGSDYFLNYTNIGGPVRGFGNGAVSFTIGDNQQTTVQTGAITVYGGTLTPGTNVLTITQAAGSCTDPVFDNSQLTFPPTGGVQSLSISLPRGCQWNLINAASWVTLTDNGLENGTGTLSLSAGPNSFGQRQGTISIGGKPVDVMQSGGACTVALTSTGTSFGAQGGTGGMTFTTTGSACAWTVSSSAPWIQISSTGSSGQGSGTAPFIVAANPGALARTGMLSVGDQIYTVTQSGGPAANTTAYTQSTLYVSVSSPAALAFDGSGNLYIADSNRVRVFDPLGNLTTFAGGGTMDPGDGGAPTDAVLSYPAGVAVDSAGTVYISDSGHQKVRKVQNNVISTFAGTGVAGFNGDKGAPTLAELNGPTGLALDSSGNLYIAEESSQRLREISNGIINTIAGTGTAGVSGDGGSALSAELESPFGVATDSAGNVYLGAVGDCRIRKITPSGIINTVATTLATNDCGVSSVAVDASNTLYITNGLLIEKITPSGAIQSVLDIDQFTTALIFGLAVDMSGDVFYTRSSTVYKLTPVPSFCSYTVATRTTAPLAGGSVTIQVTTAAGCSWSAASILPWAALVGSSNATGSGSVTFTVTARAMERTGIVTVAGQNITILQGPFSPAPATVTYDIVGTGKQDVMVYYPGLTGYQYALLSAGNGTYASVPSSGINSGSATFDRVLRAILTETPRATFFSTAALAEFSRLVLAMERAHSPMRLS